MAEKINIASLCQHISYVTDCLNQNMFLLLKSVVPIYPWCFRYTLKYSVSLGFKCMKKKCHSVMLWNSCTGLLECSLVHEKV